MPPPDTGPFPWADFPAFRAAARAANQIPAIEQVPADLASRQQWLIWRYEPGETAEKKPRKIPYWPAGPRRRVGEQGGELDRSRLTDFAHAAAVAKGCGYDGVGFAFLPGDGLIGIDLDGMIDPETGAISDRCASIIVACASYTEYSPSGKGVHIICTGDATTIKSNAIGVELFVGRQYFTFTGRAWPGAPVSVNALDGAVVRRIEATIRTARQASAPGAPAAADSPVTASAPLEQFGGRQRSRAETVALAEEALAFISPHDYESWIAVGMACKAGLGSAGFMVWDEWSARSEKYAGSDDTHKRWQGFRPDRITLGSLFKLAEDGGWVPPWVKARERKPRGKAQLVAVPRHVVPAGADSTPAEPLPDTDSPTLQDSESQVDNPAPAAPTGAGGRGGAKKPVNWERYHDLMDNFVMIYGTPTCFDMRARLVLQVNHLRLAYGSDYVKMWLGSDNRKMILPQQLVFSPGVACEFPEVNLFDGLPIEPKPGDCSLIMELLRHLCADSADTPEAVEGVVQWVLKWIALPLQRLGTKMQSAQIFHGPEGAGKNLFWEIVGKIYGRYAVVVGQKQLEGDFNDWASQKMLVIGDEVVTRQELYHHKGDLKKFITGETIQINPKGLPLREERNHCNVIFLSNEHQPLALGDTDRRYFVVYTPARREDDLYKRVGRWAAEGGIAAFYDLLLHVDLTGFSQYDIPPMTRAKRDLIELGLRPEERFVREWMSGYLPLPLAVCSGGQLYRAFRRWAMVNGERFPPAQESFTKSARKTISSMSDRVAKATGKHVLLIDYKPIKLDDAVNGQRVARMWKPDGTHPPDGQSEGKWAAVCQDTFEELLGRYMALMGGDKL